MSNFIYVNVFCDSSTKEEVMSIVSAIKQYCVECGRGANFEKNTLSSCNSPNIMFRLSDNFGVLYCEQFMESIIYTWDGVPIVDSLKKDLDVLYGLITLIFSYASVDKIELRFSYIEVDECEYKECPTNVSMMKSVIFSEYLSSIEMPVIKVIITR